MKLYEYFDQVTVISLPFRTDRRKELEVELKLIEWDRDKVLIFDAIRPEQAANFASIGELGCFLSHLKVITDAYTGGVNNLLIMEDDVSFNSCFFSVERNLIQEMSLLKADVIFFGHNLDCEKQNKNVLFELSEEKRVRRIGTHCYALSRKAMLPLIKYLHEVQSKEPGHPEGGSMGIDGCLNMFLERHPQYKAYLSNPSIAYQRSSRQDIHTWHFFDKNPLTRPIISFLRRIKNSIQRRFKWRFHA